jgi:hypothetical protein
MSNTLYTLSRSALQAGQFVKKLQALLRCVGSSNANMEEVGQDCLSMLIMCAN